MAKKAKKDTDDFDKVKKADTKIILINGEKLAELMYDYNIGFDAGEKMELKKIDEGYFSNQWDKMNTVLTIQK